MHRSTVPAILVRILVVPVLYLVYTLAIWLLPARSPTLLPSGSTSSTSESLERFDAGRRVWLEQGCQACHSIYGLGGHLGPDLTNATSSGSGAFVQVVVREGRAGMPAFALSSRELRDLVGFLEIVDATGRYPPRSITDPVFGAVR